MAPENEQNNWALRQFLESQAHAIERIERCIGKMTVTLANVDTMHHSTISTLLKIVEIELGGLLLLAGIKIVEFAGIIP